MARTKLSEILRRYREQEEQAKQEYKQERGLKIARGFEETSEAKRIAKNRQNALYRYRINQLKETNAPGLTIDDLVSKPEEVKKPTSVVTRSESGLPWWQIISYGEMDDIGQMLSQGNRNLVIKVGGKTWANANAFRAKVSLQEASEAASKMQREKYGGDSQQPQGKVSYILNPDGSETILIDIQ